VKEKIDVLFIAANARSLLHNRGRLIESMKEQGLNVAALVPGYDYIEDVESLDITIEKYDLDRHSLNPLAFISQLLGLIKKVKKMAPRAVFCYSIKPIALGAIAARLSGVKYVFCLVTGLGYAYCADGLKPRLVRVASRFLYGSAAVLGNLFIFQNEDDKQELSKGWLFKLANMLGKEKIVVGGSGVDIEEYPYQPVPEDGFSFLCMARLIKEKGVIEYAEAAKQVKAVYPDTVFYLAGSIDENLVSAINRDTVTRWENDHGITYLGQVSDVNKWIGDTTVFVLPSYREGTSRAILEAMSIGRPILTTNVPGCRGPVVDGLNGYLAKEKDAESLRDAMIKMIEEKQELQTMGLASRQRIQQIYEVKKVNANMLDAMNAFLIQQR
jgi:glycosyltransferase involved in cell wall biosynthesis